MSELRRNYRQNIALRCPHVCEVKLNIAVIKSAIVQCSRAASRSRASDRKPVHRSESAGAAAAADNDSAGY
jgi:hypothetical protein